MQSPAIFIQVIVQKHLTQMPASCFAKSPKSFHRYKPRTFHRSQVTESHAMTVPHERNLSKTPAFRPSGTKMLT